MSLAAGTRLGPYEVLGLIGAGGMGEVYKARDTRLDRTVAIKILPAELSADPDPSADSASSRAKSRDERRARFEREAKTIAGLSHSHICTLFDVGAHDGTTYLVMEHLVGETVAERLRKGPLPLDQALTVGAEIADALAAAHRQHIIHRDLKPGNVMLTKAGAKLLDFGLAKLTGHGERPALADGATAATMTAPITERGTILGTLQYMAPEQLEGREADARTDLWALGAILCEMVTGRRAFEGDSQVSLIGNIMNAEPPGLATQQPLTPPSLERVVKKCLAKAPDDRWDTAHDVADELRWILQLNSASHPASDLRQRPSRRRVIAAFGAMIATAAGGFAVGRLVVPRTASSAIVVRFSVVADALVPQRSSESTIATSSDGRLFVFIGQFEGTRVLFLRRIDQDIVRQIAGTADATSPFLSPDGRWVAFFRDGQLLKVSLEGGPAQRIADAPSGRGGVWRSDGMIFFAPTFSGPIVQVSANGGVPQPVTVLDAKAGEDSHRFPELMPNGDVLLFTARHGAGFEDATVAAVRLATGERMTLLTGGVKGRYVPTGHLVFARATTLMAVAFDPQSLEARGSPMALLDGVDYRAIGGVSDFAVSDAGTLVYVPASAQAAELVRVQLDGSARSIGVPLAPFRAVSLSPDGRFGVVSTDRGERTDLHILDIDRGVLRPLSRGYRDETPFWCPHDARIIFSSSRKAPMALFSVSVGAAEQPHEIPISWTMAFRHLHCARWTHCLLWRRLARDPVGHLDAAHRRCRPWPRASGHACE